MRGRTDGQLDVSPSRPPAAGASVGSSLPTIHEQQQQYVDAVTNHGFDFGLTVADAFVRSIRSLGYRHCGTALDELIDNAIEAEAEQIHIAFGFEDSDAKPTSIAVIDDGVGMVPDMIRAAVVWGGTHREAGRGGFGRFGYGLPSASVSQGRSFTVYSRTTPGQFHAVTLDIDDISAGRYVRGGRVVVPKARVRKLPTWIDEYVALNCAAMSTVVRTVVVWEKLDHLTWRTASALERNLLQHFGVTYRNYLRKTRLVVNRHAVDPIDPLFITPAARFYDLDGDHAEAIDPITVSVRTDEGDALGTLVLRISYIAPTFFRKDKTKKAIGKNANARFSVRKDHNGVVVCRLGRQLDVTTKCPYTTFVNNDRSIGLEIDFPPSLDSEFGVTTAKQQVTISDRVWELLRENGFLRVLEALRRRYKEESADADTGFAFSDGDSRPSERVMKELEDEIGHGRQSAESEEALEREVTRLAKETGVPKTDIRKAKEAEARSRPFKVERESQQGAPFYRVESHGSQHILYLNTAHRFFTDIYAAIDGANGAQLRSALELLLLAIGSCELDAEGSGRFWYASERVEWSKRLAATLAHLEDHIELATDEPEIITADDEL